MTKRIVELGTHELQMLIEALKARTMLLESAREYVQSGRFDDLRRDLENADEIHFKST